MGCCGQTPINERIEEKKINHLFIQSKNKGLFSNKDKDNSNEILQRKKHDKINIHKKGTFLNKEIKKRKSILSLRKEKTKKDKGKSISIEDIEIKSIKGKNVLNSKNEKIKEDQKKGSSNLKENKVCLNQINSVGIKIFKKSKPKPSIPQQNEYGNIINFFLFSKIDLIKDKFIPKEQHSFEKYDDKRLYEFTKCNYIFITPKPLYKLFSSFYSKIFKNSIIFFPNNFEQAKILLNNYKTLTGNKENLIVIAPCDELEENIEAFHDNKKIYYFIGYCPIASHKHNLDLLYKFYKYFRIVYSYEELVKNLTKLNKIFYYRKKQKYEINNNINNIFDFKYDTKFLFDFHNECTKNHVIYYKYFELYNFQTPFNKNFF